MEQKPQSISNILSEVMILRDFLGLPQTKSGKSRIVSSWVRQGLKYTKVSGQRYFFEQDLIDFFWGKYSGIPE
jgi:hypothetical protein